MPRYRCPRLFGLGAQQLESELDRDDWLTAPADSEIIFGDDDATKWRRAFAKAGLRL